MSSYQPPRPPASVDEIRSRINLQRELANDVEQIVAQRILLLNGADKQSLESTIKKFRLSTINDEEVKALWETIRRHEQSFLDWLLDTSALILMELATEDVFAMYVDTLAASFGVTHRFGAVTDNQVRDFTVNADDLKRIIVANPWLTIFAALQMNAIRTLPKEVLEAINAQQAK